MMKRYFSLAAAAGLLAGCGTGTHRDILTSSHSSAVPGSTAASHTHPATASPEPFKVPPVPRFSVSYMDTAVKPSDDFYAYAAGSWRKNNPVPSDKSRWSGFEELDQRNWFLIRSILEDAAAGRIAAPKARQVGDLYAAAMDTNRIEKLAFAPLAEDFGKIAAVRDAASLIGLVGELHVRSTAALFGSGVEADAKNSSVYAFYVSQGGLGLPDRDYYLADGFAQQREAYRAHIVRMLTLAGDAPEAAASAAGKILELETALAKASKPRVELRDPLANYNKLDRAGLARLAPGIDWNRYFTTIGTPGVTEVIVGQTNFLAGLGGLLSERPIADWKSYVRWHVIRDAAPWLHAAAAQESFAFYGTTLRGQPAQEPRWQRAAKLVDANLGEALGAVFVERHFTPAARARMAALVTDLRAVFADRVQKLDWMSDATKVKARQKFERFTEKIGHPATFRDYSAVVVRRDNLVASLGSASAFEHRRRTARLGGPVDRTEWEMTPQTVNAYFNPLQNEIVFPAGILQPPFFDAEIDDAVNYGAIGVVIGHEITHGYDDEGRKFDASGNINDWWTDADAKEFEGRAQKLVDQYGSYEPLPGKKVNGRLTLGENIADLGGITIAFDALQRSLARDPSKRRVIDGFTPEQRFFLSLAQLWRANYREAELQRRLVIDPHSPAMYRGFGPHVNHPAFYQAFGITEGSPMWLAPEKRAVIW